MPAVKTLQLSVLENKAAKNQFQEAADMSIQIEAAKGIVLVVDDEPLLRMHAADIVAEAGFSTIEAANADEAIKILESRSDIKLIVTDIDMPKGSMNGLRLAAAVRDRWPPIQIIVVSGHYKTKESELPAGSVFLEKPFEPESLKAHIVRLAA